MTIHLIAGLLLGAGAAFALAALVMLYFLGKFRRRIAYERRRRGSQDG